MNEFTQQNIRFGAGGEGITHAVQRLILVNAMVFAGQLLLHIPLGTHPMYVTASPIYQGLAFSPQALLHGFIWTPFTYLFLHSGLMHMLNNMIGLLIFGPTVERVLGTRQFYTFYFVCGVLGVLLGNLPVWALSLDLAPITIGASGATLGVLVGSAILEPNRRIVLFPIPIPITTRGIVMFVVAMDLLRLVEGHSGVAVLTHFGGMAVAYAYMKARPKWTKHRLQRKEQQLKSKQKTVAKQEKNMADAVDNIFDFKNK